MTDVLTVLESVSPATGEVVGKYPVHDADAVQAAVDAARGAAEWWAGLGFGQRRQRLLAWKRIVVRRLDELGRMMHRETGKPFDDAVLEGVLAIQHIDWAARHAAKVLGPHRVRPGLLAANVAASVEYQPLAWSASSGRGTTRS